MKKILLIIFDGLGDRPVKELNNKTPLEAAAKPNIDILSRRSRIGSMNSMPTNLYPTSEESHLSILGYDFVKDYPGRGVLEALGIGIKLGEDELAFRVDFGTVDDDLKLIDARAGVIENTKKLCKSIDAIKIDEVMFRIYPSLLHRGVLVISGEPVKKYLEKIKKAGISDTDPHKSGPHKLDVRVLHPKSFGDSREGKTVARALERYQFVTHQILKEHKINRKRIKRGQLPANFILTRGGGHLGEVQSFKEKFGLSAACVAGAPLYKGIASYLGMKVLKVRGATGTYKTNIKNKVDASIGALRKYDFVFMHLKGTDMVAEEEGDFVKKRDFIERADKQFAKLLDLKDTVIVITGDHATPCALKDHSTDIVPLLVHDGKNADNLTFGEAQTKKGSLRHIWGKQLMDILLESSKK